MPGLMEMKSMSGWDLKISEMKLGIWYMIVSGCACSCGFASTHFVQIIDVEHTVVHLLLTMLGDEFLQSLLSSADTDHENAVLDELVC